MSEYANICINDYELWWFRNYLDNGIVKLLFSDNELTVTPNVKCSDEQDDDSTFTQYKYSTTVFNAKNRLDALGFSIEKFEKLFNENAPRIVDYGSYLFYLNRGKKLYMEDDVEVIKARINKYVSFKKWENSIKKTVKFESKNKKITELSRYEHEISLSTECDKIIYHSLISSSERSFYGLLYEEIDVGYSIRLILDSFDDDDTIELDFSCLQYWDDIEKSISISEDIEKSIVLVEGTSDKDILEFALKNIYPNMFDLFYFMDFDSPDGIKRDGGTSFLSKNLQMFYFSKIRTKFLAIFDNDAQGIIAEKQLKACVKNWPDNFRILHYPNLQFAKKYPTIAPSGQILFDDINGKACSIELYLPERVLKEDGQFPAIEWENRIKAKVDGETVYAYQGVITQKDLIKRRFINLKNEINNGVSSFELAEWNNMKILIDSLVFAFK